MVETEGVGEPPIRHRAECRAHVGVEEHAALPLFRSFDVASLGRDVEVAAQDQRLGRAVVAVQIGAQAPEPLELEGVLVRSDDLSVGDVHR
jgi:hypothetical protein